MRPDKEGILGSYVQKTEEKLGQLAENAYFCRRFAKEAYQGVLVRLDWLRSDPSEPDADNAAVGMKSMVKSKHVPLSLCTNL